MPCTEGTLPQCRVTKEGYGLVWVQMLSLGGLGSKCLQGSLGALGVMVNSGHTVNATGSPRLTLTFGSVK